MDCQMEPLKTNHLKAGAPVPPTGVAVKVIVDPDGCGAVLLTARVTLVHRGFAFESVAAVITNPLSAVASASSALVLDRLTHAETRAFASADAGCHVN